MYAFSRSAGQPGDIDWHSDRHPAFRALPEAQRRALSDTGSLTRTLLRHYRGDFRVQVLSQGWQRPRPGERQLLGMPHRGVAVIREVGLIAGGAPRVFARSVMPAQSLVGHLRRLRKFDDSSLGQLLFSDPSMRRGPYAYARVDASQLALPGAWRVEGAVWGRYSCFWLRQQPLMVSEWFLPDYPL